MQHLWLIDSYVFKHPFTCLIAGPTQCGKTYFISQVLLYKDILINPVPQRTIYCYMMWQPIYDEIRNANPNIEFHQGLIDFESELNESENNLLILDDLMNECDNSQSIMSLFTVGSHHKNTSVFFLVQNLFSRGKYMRTISLNSHYIILFKNPRDRLQILTLARQMFPNKIKFLIESFDDASENKSHSYLFLDLKQQTENKNRVQTAIIPGEKRILYTSKK